MREQARAGDIEGFTRDRFSVRDESLDAAVSAAGEKRRGVAAAGSVREKERERERERERKSVVSRRCTLGGRSGNGNSRLAATDGNEEELGSKRIRKVEVVSSDSVCS